MREIFRGVDAFPWISVYVHGSWADETRTAFSDLDDLVVVHGAQRRSDHDIRRLERWLNVVDLRFLRKDPLQHHGHWIIHSVELTCLDESYMPLVVLEDALVIQGEPRLEAIVDNTSTRRGLERNLTQTVRAIAAWTREYEQGTLNLYDTKHLIGAISLLPAYVIQLRGEYVDKSAAIRMFHDAASIKAREALDWATDARAGWAAVQHGPGYWALEAGPLLVRNPNLHRRLASRFSPRLDNSTLPRLDPEAVTQFLREASAMAGV